jgi:hypothetical protein
MQRPQNDHPSRGAHPGLTYSPVDRSRQTDNGPSRKNSPWRLAIGLCLAVALVILGFAIVYPSQFKHQIEISIVRQPTPYTQLYFTRPATLSGKLNFNQKNSFNFTIENDEGRAYRYTYIVTVDDTKSHLTISQESVTVGNGGRATRIVTLVPKDRKSKYLITVTLVGMNQSIHFYGRTP